MVLFFEPVGAMGADVNGALPVLLKRREKLL